MCEPAANAPGATAATCRPLASNTASPTPAAVARSNCTCARCIDDIHRTDVKRVPASPIEGAIAVGALQLFNPTVML